MSDWIQTYLNLLIIQYFDQPKAKAELTKMLEGYENIYVFFRDFLPSFDLDRANGHRLDIIGRIVGLPRLIDTIIPKEYFGFRDQNKSKGFNEGFMYRKSDGAFSSLLLDDAQYRRLLKAKIIKNTSKATITGIASLQESIHVLFGENAYVVDNKDMTITVYIDEVQEEEFVIIRALGLIPSPQGVGINLSTEDTTTIYLGFKRDTSEDAGGFGNIMKRRN